jgi:hypothetical protein
MGAQDVLFRFFNAPTGTISERSLETVLVGVSNTLKVISWEAEALLGLGQEKGIVSVTSWVALGLEKRVKIPE